MIYDALRDLDQDVDYLNQEIPRQSRKGNVPTSQKKKKEVLPVPDAKLMNSDDLKLKYRWCLWFHKIDNDCWDIKSYRMVYAFDNVRDFWRMNNNLPSVFSGMFFVMKEGIMPVYEDPKNIEGALYSFRIIKKKIQEVWNELLLALIGNTLYPEHEQINGVSVNPKNCVIKLWLSEEANSAQTCRVTTQIPFLIPSKALFLRQKDGIK